MPRIINVDVPAHSMAEIDALEIAVRIVEAQVGMQRPAGMNASETLEAIEPLPRAGALRAANAVCDYVANCLSNSSPVM